MRDPFSIVIRESSATQPLRGRTAHPRTTGRGRYRNGAEDEIILPPFLRPAPSCPQRPLRSPWLTSARFATQFFGRAVRAGVLVEPPLLPPEDPLLTLGVPPELGRCVGCAEPVSLPPRR